MKIDHLYDYDRQDPYIEQFANQKAPEVKIRKHAVESATLSPLLKILQFHDSRIQFDLRQQQQDHNLTKGRIGYVKSSSSIQRNF